jgi:phosphoglucosamine mutase
MVEQGRPLSELSRVMTAFPQVLLNVKVRERVPVERLAGASAAIAAVESELAQGGRVLVRYSGTEPKLRVMIEGEEEGRIGEMARRIADAVKAEIGVQVR